jgi:hypothetical protein
VTFYKFLRAGTVSPFTGYRWMGPGGSDQQEPPGAPDRPSLCRAGIHACRIRDLPYWLHDELWRIELDGDVVESDLKVVAPRGRLIERVAAWDKGMARKFGMACLVRAAVHAADELLDAGLQAEAERLGEAAGAAGRAVEDGGGREAPFGAWSAATTEAMEQAARMGARDASRLCGLVLDALELLEPYPPAMMGYVAARAADARGRAESDDPFAEERGWQANWLVEHLSLPRA